jgi:uncharacterized protein YjbI with pentapeptide repeats
MDLLTPHERRVLQVHHGLAWFDGASRSLAETAARFGRDIEAVRQTELKALRKLKTRMPPARQWQSGEFQTQLERFKDDGTFQGSDRLYSGEQLRKLAEAVMQTKAADRRILTIELRRSNCPEALTLLWAEHKLRLDCRGAGLGGISIEYSSLVSGSDFSAATFDGPGAFNACRFDGRVSFTDATFAGAAQFARVVFENEADLTRVQFRGPTAFGTLADASRHFPFSRGVRGTARFNSTALFTDATFYDDVSFDQAKFEAPPSFAGSTFHSRCSFRSTYARGASFAQAVFGQPPLFTRAQLDESNFGGADLAAVDFAESSLAGANLRSANLAGANLTGSFMDIRTNLDGAVLAQSSRPRSRLVNVRWGGAQVTGVDWSPVPVVLARGGVGNTPAEALQENIQLALLLESQGLVVDAGRFSLQARRLERGIRGNRGFLSFRVRWLGSLLLDVVSGYGFQMERAVAAYVGVVATFAAIYALSPRLFGWSAFQPAIADWWGYLAFSAMSFHGRGFLTNGLNASSPLALIAATESLVGLVIEVILIATLTRRLFRQ